MNITTLSVDNRTTMAALALVLMASGGLCYRSMPLESDPEIKLPMIQVETDWRGASPTDVEKSITVKIEDKLKGLNGVKRVKSTSSEGRSEITVEFDPGVDVDFALQRVKDKVDLARPDLPSDLEDEPAVTEFSFSEIPVAGFCLRSADPDDDLRLGRLAEQLQDELEALPGVLAVDLSGRLEREIQIQLHPERLALYGLTAGDVVAAVQKEHVNVSGGVYRQGEGGRLAVRVEAEIREPGELLALAVRASGDGDAVYLRDVADVVDGAKDRDTRTRVNTRPTVTLLLKKRLGANVVEVVDRAKAHLDRFARRLPPGYTLTTVSDSAKEIRHMVDDLSNNLATGFLLVTAVVALALGVRNGLVVALIIPITMLAAFILLKLLGATLNMVVLFSLSLSTGMLVDTAIVLIENVYRFMARGVPRLEAARLACAEVAWPVAGSGLTTIVAFVPLLAWPGVMGDFMRYLPLTLVCVLSANLFVALFISPALAAWLLRVHGPVPVPAASDGGVDPAAAAPAPHRGGLGIRAYRRVLGWALRFRLATLALALLATVSSGMAWYGRTGLENPVEFFVTADPGEVEITATLPQGADLAYADRVTKEIAARIFDVRAGSAAENNADAPLLSYAEAGRPREGTKASTGGRYETRSDLPDVEYILETAGENSVVSVRFVDYADRRGGSTRKTSAEIARRVEGVPGAILNVVERADGPPTESPIHIEIEGPDYVELGRLADEMKRALARVPHVRGLRHDFEEGAPTLRVTVNRARAAMLGLSPGAIGETLRVALTGVKAGVFRADEKDYDILVRFRDNERVAADALERVMLVSPTHGPVPLASVARMAYGGAPGAIRRVGFRRVVTVEGDIDSLRTTGDTARRAAGEVLASGFALPDGYRYTFAGEAEDQDETGAFLFGLALPLAVMLVLFVLVAQFNSIWIPLVIVGEVLLAVGGAFLGLFAFDLPFSVVMAGIAVISLAGVVVNNGIVLIDYAFRRMAEGVETRAALLEAGTTRLRPVLLTAVTTMLGVMPFLLEVNLDVWGLSVEWDSESARFWRTMAAVTVFGLGYATVLTLVAIPAAFSLGHDFFGPDGARPWRRLRRGVRGIVGGWWRPFDRRHGTRYAERWRG